MVSKGLLSLSKFSLTKFSWSKFLKDFWQWQRSKKTLIKNFEGLWWNRISSYFFLKLGWTLMGISQSELSFGMMQFCLPNKEHMVKTAGKAEFCRMASKTKKSVDKWRDRRFDWNGWDQISNTQKTYWKSKVVILWDIYWSHFTLCKHWIPAISLTNHQKSFDSDNTWLWPSCLGQSFLWPSFWWKTLIVTTGLKP